ncbi:MAG TPA: peptidase M54 [Myxococcales bacterium]
MEHARAHLATAFGDEVALEVHPGAPADAYDPRRDQHLSGRLLGWMAQEDASGTSEDRRVLGVTGRDLFIPILTFVFGEAQLGGRTAVVSIARLRPPPTAPRAANLLRSRLAKECAHELGHAYSLRHCDRPRCVMGRSASVMDVDGKEGLFCADCRARMQDFKQRQRGSALP